MKNLIYWTIAITLAALSTCIVHFAGFHSVIAQVSAAYFCCLVQPIIAFIAAEKIYGAYQ
jgi:hypothetical protein